MPVQTKRKVATKKEVMSVNYERLRLRHWVMFWVLVAATHALVIAIFSNVDVRTLLPVNVVNDEQMAVEQELVDQLKDQVKALEASLQSIAATNAPTPTGYIDNRCLEVDKTPIDNYLTYMDPKTSVKVTIPFSTAWLSDACVIPPAKWITDSDLLFGPVVKSGGEAQRDSRLWIDPERSTAAKHRELLKNPSEGTIKDLRERTINGIPVFSYQVVDGIGSIQYTWRAVGRTNTYNIYSFGWLTDAEAIKIIQSLRVTK